MRISEKWAFESGSVILKCYNFGFECTFRACAGVCDRTRVLSSASERSIVNESIAGNSKDSRVPFVDSRNANERAHRRADTGDRTCNCSAGLSFDRRLFCKRTSPLKLYARFRKRAKGALACRSVRKREFLPFRNLCECAGYEGPACEFAQCPTGAVRRRIALSLSLSLETVSKTAAARALGESFESFFFLGSVPSHTKETKASGMIVSIVHRRKARARVKGLKNFHQDTFLFFRRDVQDARGSTRRCSTATRRTPTGPSAPTAASAIGPRASASATRPGTSHARAA